MKQPGDLIQDDAYAFSFRVLEPRPAAARRLLLLLHGVGSDELQLAALGADVDAGTLVALPRAQRSISGAGLGWFREGFDAEGPLAVAEEADESRHKLAAFVSRLQARFEVRPAHTVLAGFSQGGILAASVALTAQARVAGFALCCGRLLPDIDTQLAPRARLARLEALVLHGRDDSVLPLAWAERADAALERWGVPHETRLYPADHEFTRGMRGDFLQWFRAPARRWNRDVRPT